MTDDDADRIIGMIEAHWGRRIGEARPFWIRYLSLQDAEMVTIAVARLSERQEEFPKIADVRDMLGTVTGSTEQLEAGMCRTCFDDRMVLVALRAPVQSTWMAEHGLVPSADSMHEEYVPCPDCNADADTDYYVIGKPYRPPDPATVRERMQPAGVDPDAPRSREVPDSVREWLANGPRGV
jgi:hypothetical protein